MDCKTAQQMILPYIQRKLNDKELENFIEHIKECPECHEELEIYFTIYFALERLDDESHMNYNIQKLLVDDLHSSEHRVHRRKIMRFYRHCFMAVAQLALLIVLFTQFQMWGSNKTIQQTTIYEFVYGNPKSEIDENLKDIPQIYQIETLDTEEASDTEKSSVKKTPETESSSNTASKKSSNKKKKNTKKKNAKNKSTENQTTIE
ncbi:MAG: zf-HC2 domain-containing protein [Clostridiales bacterium]|nr:zf-HC2 domain-containing protein [Clostridiales bacterium]MDU3239164.1 zf-HC2 domain-containing protein [Clostridiales bacterium]